MTLTNAVKICLFKKYFCLDGRASRSEYVWFTLFSLLIQTIIIISVVALNDFDFTYKGKMVEKLAEFGALLPFLLPLIGVAVRRLHDIGLSGKWYLIVFIPAIGQILLLYLCFAKSKEYENEYGGKYECDGIFSKNDINLVLAIILPSIIFISALFIKNAQNNYDSMMDIKIEMEREYKKKVENELTQEERNKLIKEIGNRVHVNSLVDDSDEYKIAIYLVRRDNIYNELLNESKRVLKNIENARNICFASFILLITFFVYLIALFLYSKFVVNKGASFSSFKSQRIGILLFVCGAVLIVISVMVCGRSFEPVNHFGRYAYSALFFCGLSSLLIGALLVLMIPQSILNWVNGNKSE